MQDVRFQGKVIGQAATAEEAAQLVAKAKAGNAKEAPAKKPAASEPARPPSPPLFTTGPPSKNFPNGQTTYTGPGWPTAQPTDNPIDPKRNWPTR